MRSTDQLDEQIYRLGRELELNAASNTDECQFNDMGRSTKVVFSSGSAKSANWNSIHQQHGQNRWKAPFDALCTSD